MPCCYRNNRLPPNLAFKKRETRVLMQTLFFIYGKDLMIIINYYIIMHAVLSISAIKCYHCDIPLMDYHDCYKTKTCAKGEVSAKCISITIPTNKMLPKPALSSSAI